jgi:hypothetical protein
MPRTMVAVACVVVLSLTKGVSLSRSTAAADPITEWSVAASNAAAASGMSPLRVPITFAILHLAMHDAVTAVSGDRRPHVARAHVTGRASAYAAAVEAGYRVLLFEFPSQQAALQIIYERLLAGEPDEKAKRIGVKVGAAVAHQLLTLRANDGRNDVVTYVPGSGPGVWVPTPPGFLPADSAFLARVTPFTMTRPSQFRPSGPPRLRSKRWTADYDEVTSFGAKNSTTRTPEQTATALFWQPLAGTVWPATIRRVAREQQLDLTSAARFQAATFAAFADALIACWDAKFHFNFWRPVTAIQQGDTDRNPRTEADPDWEPLAETPNFPEYPSGHACATAAVAHTIEDFFEYDVDIPARNVVTGEERFYRRAKDAVDEVVEARMLLGIHFRTGDEDGADIGVRIARQIRREWFKRKD